MTKEELTLKIKNLGDFGFTGEDIEFKDLLITASTQEDEEGIYYFVYGEDDESEDGIFNSNNPEEIVEFVFNY
jgi:IMP cyclohydrolase